MIRRPGPALALVSALALGACATALPPTASPRDTPSAWSESAAILAPEVEDRWWLAYGDPVLNDLVARADLGDDPAIAEARLAEAVARLSSARARLRPELGGAIDGEANRVDDLEQDQIRGLISLAWSPDLNGARGLRADAAAASLIAEAARAAAVRQATRATAVRLYIAVREGQDSAAASERSARVLADSLDLAESRERAGLTSGLDPVAARAQLAAARARPAAAREAAETARLGLEALLGLSPGALSATLAETPDLRLAVAADPLLSPVAVLARRPDLIAAEQDLAAAGFESQAARRDFWPTVSLGAALGLQGADPETPSLVSGSLGQLTAGLTSPIVSFGRLEAARDGADARRTLAALTYRRAATQALSEVERALVAARSAETRALALAEAEAAGRDRVSLATSRYRAGLSAFLDVLAAEDALAEAEAALVTARADRARARASLSVALGLGAA